ncbi:MAG: hypothetical protein U0165_07220 [Polyangiaceae bacterium]
MSAFQGIESIRLRDDIKTRILRKMPNLYDAIMEESTKDRVTAVGGKMIEFPGLRAISGEKGEGIEAPAPSEPDPSSDPTPEG